VAAFDGTTLRLYINGSQVATGNYAGLTPVATPIRYIGDVYNIANQNTMTGALDDVRLYNRALSATEIAQQYGSYNANLQINNLSKGLVGDWPLNGNAKDSTPYRNGMSIGNTVTPAADRKGRANSAYYFSEGTGGCTGGWLTKSGLTPSSPFATLSNGMTMSVWVMRTQLSTYQYPTFFGYSGHQFYILRSATYGQSVYFEYGTPPYDGTAWAQAGATMSLPANQWHMFTVTYDGSTVRTYKDGVVAGQTAGVTLNPNPLTQVTYSSNCSPFEGYMDDGRIYNRALSASEVSALYNSYR
jgi:hypothetical protein